MRRSTGTHAARQGPSLFLFFLLSFVLSACASLENGTEPETSPTPVAQGTDAELLALAQDAPGFGGMFYAEDGTLNVYVQRGTLDTLSEAALERTFAEYLARPLRGGLSTQNRRELKVVAGEYAFRDLFEWRSQLSLDAQGVVLTDVDERLNRVRVGVEDSEAEAELKAYITAQGIPLDAVVTEQVTPFKVTQSLSDKVRPLVSGLGIETDEVVCTLGFNAVRDGQRGFVTNSHCTDKPGGVERTRYSQGGARVGVEVADPKYTERDGCSKGRRCRLSDSAFVATKGVKRNTDALAATRSQNDMKDPDTTVAKQLDIVRQKETTVSGEKLDKIGRTTGWTYGEVEDTCVTVNVFEGDEDTGRTLLCQDVIAAGAGDGDSGAPVFSYAGDKNKVTLRGIMWGESDGEITFSPIGQIYDELGLPRIDYSEYK